MKRHSTKTKKMLRKLIIESAREVVLEHQHEKEHEQKEMTMLTQIRQCVDQLIAMHQKGAYDEAKEIQLVRHIKNIAMKIDSMHTGTKITAAETTVG